MPICIQGYMSYIMSDIGMSSIWSLSGVVYSLILIWDCMWLSKYQNQWKTLAISLSWYVGSSLYTMQLFLWSKTHITNQHYKHSSIIDLAEILRMKYKHSSGFNESSSLLYYNNSSKQKIITLTMFNNAKS